jgi:hypothetical protein
MIAGSIKTVAGHWQNILDGLGMRDRVEQTGRMLSCLRSRLQSPGASTPRGSRSVSGTPRVPRFPRPAGALA